MAQLLSFSLGFSVSALAFLFLALALAQLGRALPWSAILAFVLVSLNLGVFFFGFRCLAQASFFSPLACAAGLGFSLLLLALLVKTRYPLDSKHG